MLKNRYVCVNILGTIEKNSGANSWILRKNNELGITNANLFNLFGFIEVNFSK